MSGMNKNDLKNFMKQTLSKTKEESNQGFVIVGGNGYKKINHFKPKKKKEEKKRK